MSDPLSASKTPMNEVDVITEITDALLDCGLSIDTSDDCGHWSGTTDMVSVDTLVEYRHFDRRWDSPRQIGRQAAIINLSDLAGSGGSPEWAVWSLVLNAEWSRENIYELALGFGEVMSEHQCAVIGGNLASSPGPTHISVTVGGRVMGDAALRRDGASPGDKVYVSGVLGTSSMGYLSPSEATRSLRHSWRPHLREAQELAESRKVSACMDISDGLLLDAGRLAQASGVLIDLARENIPVHPEFSIYMDTKDAALGGGEDYVLLFTASPDFLAPDWAIHIGQCEDGQGIQLDGCSVDPRGHDHFAVGRG